MIVLAIVVFSAILFAVLGCWLAKKLRLPLIVLGLLPTGASFLLWGGGTVWIFSPYCEPVDICDSGGWLAFTLNFTILFVAVVVGNIFGFVGYRLLQK